MGIRILYGLHPQTLADTCLEEVANEALAWPDRRAFLLVPEQIKADTETRYLSCLKGLAKSSDAEFTLMLVDVVSFQRLAHRILVEVGGLSEDYLDSTSRTLLLFQILNQNREQFPLLSALADRIGFIPELDSVLGDFWRYHVTSDKLRQVEGEFQDPAVAQKIKEFSELLALFDEITQSLGYCEQEQELDHLSKIISQLGSKAVKETWPLNRLSYLKNTKIWIMGFGETRNFTPQEWGVIRELARVCDTVTVAICADSLPRHIGQIKQGPPAYYFGRYTLYQLKNEFADSELQLLSETPPRAPELHHLSMCFSDYADQVYDKPCSAIKVYAASDRADELRYVAGQIRRLVLTEGYRYRDIAMVICSPPDYKGDIHSVFAAYGLEAFLDQRRPLAGTVLMEFVMALLDLTVSGWSFHKLMIAIKSGLCHIPAEEADLLENYFLKHGLFKGYRIFNPKNYSSDKDQQGPLIWANVQRVLFPLRQFHQTFSRLKTAAERAELLRNFLYLYGGEDEEYGLGIAAQVGSLAEEWQEQGYQEAALALVLSFNELVKLLEKIQGPIGQIEMNAANFRGFLAAGMEASFSGTIPAYVDQVQVSDCRRGHLRGQKVLFILGATREVFPFTAVKEGFLRGEEREKLAESLQQAFPSRAREQYYSDLFTAFALLDRVSDQLIFTYPQTAEPSTVIRQVEKLFPQAAFSFFQELDWDSPKFCSSRALQRQIYRVLYSKDAKEEDQIFARSLLWQFPELDKDFVEAVNQETVQLPLDLMQRLLPSTLNMSVSQVESYAQCPFRYFSDYILKLAPREEYRVQSNDIGSFLHHMLELSLLEYRNDIKGKPETQVQSIYDSFVKRDFFQWAEKIFWQTVKADDCPLTRDPAFLASFSGRMIRMAAYSLKAILLGISPQGFQPDKLEWRFGSSPETALQVAVNQEYNVRFRGIIDRIDLSAQKGFRVIDYKSGNKNIDYNQLFHGLSLQLPLYLRAYQSQSKDSKPMGAGYFYLTAPLAQIGSLPAPPVEKALEAELEKIYALRSMDLDSSGLELAGAYASRKVAEYCRQMVAGDFSARPQCVSTDKSKLPCGYCDFIAICGIDPLAPPAKFLPPLSPIVEEGKKLSKGETFLRHISSEEDQSSEGDK